MPTVPPVPTPRRVLVAESSAFMRRRLVSALEADGDITVVAAVADGEQALARVLALEPDVAVLEIPLPRVDGLVVVAALMRSQPLPIVATGEHAHPAAPAGRAALAAGAVALASRPPGVLLDSAAFTANVLAQVRRAARVRVVRTAGTPVSPRPPATEPALTIARDSAPSAGTSFPVVVIASSTGGPAALLGLAAQWRDRPLPAMLVAQHLPTAFTAELARQWQALCPGSEIREARTGDQPRPGLVLVAPGGRDLVVADNGTVRVAPGLPGVAWLPSANRLFASAAEAYGTRVRAIVLTGMGDDGAEGVTAVARGGGLAWAQEAASCVVDGMPAAARATGCAPARSLAELAALVQNLTPLNIARENTA